MSPLLSRFSGAKLFNSSNTSINSANTTTLTFDNEIYDTDGYHSLTANTDRLTCPFDGFYRLTANVRWATNATNSMRRLTISRNGTTIIEAAQAWFSVTTNSETADSNVSVTVYAIANDYFVCNVRHDVGSAVNVVGGSNLSPMFQIEYLGTV